jgi:hypothetical protein
VDAAFGQTGKDLPLGKYVSVRRVEVFRNVLIVHVRVTAADEGIGEADLVAERDRQTVAEPVVIRPDSSMTVSV